jgi:hypothetical protein
MTDPEAKAVTKNISALCVFAPWRENPPIPAFVIFVS